MIDDLKIALVGWYLGICQGTDDIELAWEQKELKDIMQRYNLSKEEVLSAMPKEWS